MLVTIAVRLPADVGLVPNVTVSEVDVAAVTVPTAPLLNVTVLSAAVVSNAKPCMVTVLAFAARLSVTAVTTGTTVATCTAVPLPRALAVTLAVMLPTVSGKVEKVIVNDVLDAVVTVPTAPLLSVTLLSSAVALKPKPLMTTVVALAARLVVLLVTTGLTVATFTGAPLLALLVVTTAVRISAAAGFVPNVTVNSVAVAAVTVPTAPSLKTTVLLPGVVSKPEPLIVRVVALANKSLVLVVMTGITVATCTALPLVMELTVTIAVKLPAAVGSVDRETVKDVAVAAVIVPSAPLLNSTVLLAAVGSKPCPVIVSVAESAAN